jgi:predicted NAD/FAD-dependent oxidoreductase
MASLACAPVPTAVLRVAVIGGGVSGLSAAFRLERAGHECVLFDTGRRGVGGRASSRGPADHAAQFLRVHGNESESFRAALEEWHRLGVVVPWKGNIGCGGVRGGEQGSYYIGSKALGIGSIATHLQSCLRTPPKTDTWISPNNGIRKQSNGQWTVHSKGIQIGGVFDAVIIAHNGKCADRLTSRTPAKMINKLLKVQFSDQPHPKKMTLNSIYSLLVEVKPGILRSDVDAYFFKGSSVLDFAACQSRKYGTRTPTGTETWTLLSHPTFAKQHKQPQEHLEGTKVSHTVVQEMLREAFRILGSSKSVTAVVRTKLQLWGAGVPINHWEAEDGAGFLWDSAHCIGVVGDWLKRSSISGAWESGEELGAFFEKVKDVKTTSKGLKGQFVPNKKDPGGDHGALVGNVSIAQDRKDGDVQVQREEQEVVGHRTRQTSRSARWGQRRSRRGKGGDDSPKTS